MPASIADQTRAAPVVGNRPKDRIDRSYLIFGAVRHAVGAVNVENGPADYEL